MPSERDPDSMADSTALLPGLLAVDLGLRAGLARFRADGRLDWYRSASFNTHARLRRAIPGLLEEASPLGWLVLEGGGPVADLWEHAAGRHGLPTLRTSAETWRQKLLLPREQRTGPLAKRAADGLARGVIEWSGARRPTSLRHDAAEAILLGLWGALELGWLETLPALPHHR